MASSSRAPRRARPSVEGILASAEALFAERGYAESSLRDLIAASGVSTTAFYARFPTKEAVLRTLVQDLLDGLYQAAARVLPEARCREEGFLLGLGVLVDALGHRKGLVRVALTAEEPETRRLLFERYRAFAALLASSSASPDDALGWALVGALDLQLRRWAVFEEVADEALAETLQRTARVFLPR